jgi:hypothetical protein
MLPLHQATIKLIQQGCNIDELNLNEEIPLITECISQTKIGPTMRNDRPKEVMSRSRGLKRRTLLWSGRLRRLRKDLSSPAIPSIWLEVMRSQQKKVLINIGRKYRRFK